MATNKPLILVDGSSYLFRAYHALPPLTNDAGEPTGAILGVVNMLQKLLDEHQPERIAVIFDAPGKTFRHEMFDEYKANRADMPDDLRPQIEPIKELAALLGMVVICESGVEADDVIGTLTKRAVAENQDVLIVTGDKDMAQLVDSRVTLLDTMQNRTLDVAGVEQKFGVKPEAMIDYLALVGDTSDNIPGIPSVGPKTAAKWLTQYGSIDGIRENAEAIKGKVGERLREHLEQLPLSRTLAEIVCDVPLDYSPDDLSRGTPDIEALRQHYTRFQLGSLLRTLHHDSVNVDVNVDVDATAAPEQAPADSGDYDVVTDPKTFAVWLKKLQQAELFAFDTETTSIDYMEAEIVGVSFAVEPLKAAYVPVAHDYTGAPEQLDRGWVLEQLRPLLENPKHRKVGQHLKYDAHVLARHGITLTGIAHDTMLQSYVLNSVGSRHDMDSLARTYLNTETIHFEDVAGKGAKQLTFNQIPLQQAGEYAAEDADITLRLHRTLWPKLQAESSLQSVYRDIELPLVEVLLRIEETGVKIDVERLAAMSKDFAERLVTIEREAHQVAGQPFNLGSTKQLQHIFFEVQALPVIKKTPKGAPSTDEDVLEQLAAEYPLPRLILDYRLLTKLLSTYIDKLPAQVKSTGRVHTSYHQAVASTGRLSSADPNLQNIPIRTDEGRDIRKAFIPEPGYRMIAADYSQIELRIMAHLSGDEALLSAFSEGRDVHRATAAEVFGVGEDDVSFEQRRASKAINFGLIYGMSAFGLARQLGIPRREAGDYVNRYFERYTGVKAFMDKTRAQAAEMGYVETVFGRRLYLPQIRSGNRQHRAAAERVAINAPMQGTAADIIKRAMIAIDRWLTDSGVDARMIMQVHDELVFEAAEDAVDAVRAKIGEMMPAAAELKVPLEVDVGTGANWDEAH